MYQQSNYQESNYQQRRYRLSHIALICGLVTLCLSACTALIAADGQPLGIAVTNRDDRVSWTRVDDGTVLDIYSPSGIGRAAVRWMAQEYPDRLLLRFHLTGLEELRLVYDTTVVTLSVASTGEPTVRQQVALADGERQEIATDSPYWMRTELVPQRSPGTNANSRFASYIEVELPPHFLRRQPAAFVLEWVDYYR